MTKDTNTSTASGAAIQRYKIGYHTDEWGQRSSTPSGIPDASGSWVRYADHVTALAAGQATAAPAGGVVAYLDIGAGGYLDLGSDLSNEAISRLPKGRHALIVAGTYGIDGYTPTPPAPAQPAPPNAITAAIVRDDGGEAPAFCLMAAYRSEKDAMDAFALIAAAPAQPVEMTDDEKHLRRMLCVAHAGALAYMDDGEASDSRMHPTIDFLRDSPKDIQRKIWECNRAALAAAPAQAAPARDLAAVIKGAADKLDAAVRCHPNAVDTLIHEALEILDGDREPDATPASHGQAPAGLSPTAGMNIPQRILHVGGRNNDAGYVEFGSIQAVEALVRQVLRDLPAPAPADSVQEDAARLDWLDQQCEAYGFQDIHEGNRWEIRGPYANVRQAIDYERAARKQGEKQ